MEPRSSLNCPRVPVSAPALAPKRPARSAATDLSWHLVQREGRSDDVVAFEESVVSFFLGAAEMLGVPKSVAAIYGICFASPEPLSFSDVRERLDISAGSISQGLRVLREVGALKVVIAPSDNRECFTPDLEMRKLIAHFLEERLQKQLTSGHGRLEGIVKAIPPAKNGSAKVLRDRMKSLQAWHDKARAVLPVVKVFLKLT